MHQVVFHLFCSFHGFCSNWSFCSEYSSSGSFQSSGLTLNVPSSETLPDHPESCTPQLSTELLWALHSMCQDP